MDTSSARSLLSVGVMHNASRTGSLSALFLGLALAACGDDSGPAGSGGSASGTGGTGGATPSGDGGSGGGDTPGGAGGAGDDAAQAAYCEDLVAHDAQCGGDTSLAECRGDIVTACIFNAMRDGVAEAVAACILERACDAEGDLESCIYDPGSEQPIPEQTAWRDACLAKRQACDAMDVIYADDDCFVSFLRAEAYADFYPCLDQACADVPVCTRAVAEETCRG